MDRVGSLLPKVLKKRGLYAHAKSALIVTQAKDWIDKELKTFASDLQPTVFKDGVLIIESSTSIAAQECNCASIKLIDHLNDGSDTVKEVRIQRSKTSQNGDKS